MQRVGDLNFRFLFSVYINVEDRINHNRVLGIGFLLSGCVFGL